MPIRNPFVRRPGPPIQDENSRPGSAGGDTDPAHPGFERVDTIGSKASPALSIRSRRSQDTGEYKMSVVNDSGVYLPPSPIEKEAAWPRRYLSRGSSDAKGSTGAGEIEHFPISRESFDSYRRSFDICAKSPVVISDPAPRQSLDSARFPRLPRSALSERRFPQAPPTPEESFEDVGLGDEKQNPAQAVPVPKKRGFFAKFGSEEAPPPAPGKEHGQGQMMTRFLPGRKRGQSGQGAELGAMPALGLSRPETAVSVREEVVQS